MSYRGINVSVSRDDAISIISALTSARTHIRVLADLQGMCPVFDSEIDRLSVLISQLDKELSR